MKGVISLESLTNLDNLLLLVVACVLVQDVSFLLFLSLVPKREKRHSISLILMKISLLVVWFLGLKLVQTLLEYLTPSTEKTVNIKV